MNLTANQMRCLLAILSLTRMNEEVASKNVARLLGVTRPSVHKALDILAGKGLIEKAHYGAAKLTQQGVELAEALEERQDGLLLLFSRRFGLDMDEASRAALSLMSELRPDSIDRLLARDK